MDHMNAMLTTCNMIYTILITDHSGSGRVKIMYLKGPRD